MVAQFKFLNSNPVSRASSGGELPRGDLAEALHSWYISSLSLLDAVDLDSSQLIFVLLASQTYTDVTKTVLCAGVPRTVTASVSRPGVYSLQSLSEL